MNVVNMWHVVDLHISHEIYRQQQQKTVVVLSNSCTIISASIIQVSARPLLIQVSTCT